MAGSCCGCGSRDPHLSMTTKQMTPREETPWTTTTRGTLSNLESRYVCFYRVQVSDHEENNLAGHCRDLVSCKSNCRLQPQTWRRFTVSSQETPWCLSQVHALTVYLITGTTMWIGRESTNQLTGMLTHILSVRYLWWEKTPAVFCSERVWNLRGTTKCLGGFTPCGWHRSRCVSSMIMWHHNKKNRAACSTSWKRCRASAFFVHPEFL